MIKCPISDEQQQKFSQQVAADILKLKSGETFSPKDYMSNIYNAVYSATDDKATALNYARLVPFFMDIHASRNMDMKTKLRAAGVSFDELTDLTINFSQEGDTLKAVATYLGLDQSELEIKAKQNAAVKVPQEKPESAPIKEAEAVAKTPINVKYHAQLRPDIATVGYMESEAFEKKADVRLPMSPLSSLTYNVDATKAGERWQESRVNPNNFFKKVERNLLAKASEQGYPEKLMLGSEGFETEVYLTLKSVATIDESEFQSDMDMSKDPEKEGILLVVTDSTGNPLYFDANGDLTFSGGKIAYYRTRTTDKMYQHDYDHIENLAHTYYNGNKAVATKAYKNEIDALMAMRAYVQKDKMNNFVKTRINGGTRGYAVKDNKKFYFLKDVDFGQPFGTYDAEFSVGDQPSRGMKDGFTYVTGVDGFHGQPIEIERSRVDSVELDDGTQLKDKLLSLLTDPIQDKGGNPYSFVERRDLIDHYLYTNPSGIQILPGKTANDFVLLFKNERQDVSTPEGRKATREKLDNYFSTFAPNRQVSKPPKSRIIDAQTSYDVTHAGYFIKVTTPREGKAPLTSYFVIEKPQLHILGTRENVNYLNAPLKDVNLETDDKGNVIMTPNTYPYKEFVLKHMGMKYQLENMKVRKYDSYMTFQPTQEAMTKIEGNSIADKIENDIADVSEIAAEQLIAERKQKAFDDIGYDIEEDAKGRPQEYYDTSYTDLAGDVHYIQKENKQDVEKEIEKLVKKDLSKASEIEEPEIEDDLTPDGYLDLGNIDDIIDDADKLNKLDTQKAKDLKATKEQIKQAKIWYENSPLSEYIPFEAIFTMVNTDNPQSVATWAVGGITLFKGSDYSDLYHEAWHAFTQSFLTKQQKKDLYGEARKKSGSFTNHLGKKVTFRSASDLELEEWMAEEFRTYMLKGGKKKITAPVRKTIFQKILDALRMLFTNSTTKEILDNERADATIGELYEKLRVGNLAEYTFSQENAQFGNLNKGIQTTNPKQKVKALSYQNSMLINDTVTSLMSQWMDKQNLGLSSEEKLRIAELESRVDDMTIPAAQRKKDTEELKALKIPKTYEFSSKVFTDPVLQLQAYTYARKRIGLLHNQTVDKINKTTNREEKAALVKRKATLLWAFEEFGTLTAAGVDPNTKEGAALILAKNTAEDSDDITGVIGFHLSKNDEFLGEALIEHFGDLDNMTEEQQQAKGRRFEQSGNERSMREIAGEDITFLIKSLHKVDKKGNYVLNKLGARELANFQEVWNRIARTLEGTLDVDVMYNRLEEESKDYPILKQLLTKLGPVNKLGSIEQQSLWTAFFKPFGMTRVPLIQMTVVKTKAGTWEANTGQVLNSGTKTLRVWESEMNMREPDKYTKRDDQGNYLNIDAILKDFYNDNTVPVERRLAGRELQFLRAIGLNVVDNPKVLKALEPGAITFLHKRLHTLKKRNIKVRTHEDYYRAYPAEMIGGELEVSKPKMESRFKNVASAHNRYSDEGSNFMVTNAEGNTQFEHSLNNSMTVMINAINSARSYEELIAMSHMANLNIETNPFAAASTWLQSIFDFSKPGGPRRQVRGEDSADIKIQFSNLSGVMVMEEDGDANVGIASAKTDEVTKLILDFHLNAQLGQSELMRHADKSSSFSASIRHIFNKNRGEISAKYINNAEFVLTTEETPLGQKAYDKAAYSYLLPHVNAEFKRITTMRTMENPENIDFNYWKRGKDFVAFNDVFTKSTKNTMLNLVGKVEDLEAYLDTEEGRPLQAILRQELADYFAKQSDKVETRFNKNAFLASNTLAELRKETKQDYLPPEAAMTALVKSFVYNSWINNIELIHLFYGDLALYKHEKEEFHKRNAGMGSTGTLFRTDLSMQKFINSQIVGRPYTEQMGGLPKVFNGTFDTAVIGDSQVRSAYYDDYVESYTRHFMAEDPDLSKKDAEAKAKKELKAYHERGGVGQMDEGDAQGWVSFDAYRIMKITEGSWSDEQDDMYKKIIAGESIRPQDVKTFFPTIKAQYFGPLQQQMKGLPITAMHKFNLMPLIPSVIAGTNLERLHQKMMNEGVDYALFESGSKVGTITKKGTADKFYEEGRSVISDAPFTKNTIFLNYLKNQLEIAPTNKGKVTFPTQLRKLIEDGLMESGVPTDFLPGVNADKRIKQWRSLGKYDKDGKLIDDSRMLEKSDRYRLLKEYENNLRLLTDIAKRKLLDRMDWKVKKVNGKEVLEGDIANLMSFVKKQLTREDLADHEIDFLDMKNGKMKDLSLSLSVDKIEKVLNALVVKELVKQTTKGEGLIQVSGALFENLATTDRNYTNPTKEDLKKYGTNDLPFYTDKINLNEVYKGLDKEQLQKVLADKKRDLTERAKNWVDSKRNALRLEIDYLESKIAGKKPKTTEIIGPTSAAKVKIALQGDFLKLLSAKHIDGKRIGSRARLNDMLKNEEWLNTDRNREMITMVGVRIPVQGLNSMEFMEVYEFLPAEAGNIIIPPAEIVAKSGSDFDVDKLTMMMPNLKEGRRGNIFTDEGASFTRMFNYTEDEAKVAYEAYRDYRASGIARTETGNLKTTEMLENLNAALARLMGSTIDELNIETVDQLVEEGKIMNYEQFKDSLIGAKSVQNDLIGNIRSILELPENFVSLTRPNSTDLFINDEGTGLAQELGPLVMEYDPMDTLNGEGTRTSSKGKSVISPTRVLEIEYNLYKHSTNNVAKDTLGLAAVDNTYNSVFNRIGFHLNPTSGMSTKQYNTIKAKLAKGEKPNEIMTRLQQKQFNEYHRQTLFLPHNVVEIDGEDAISLAHVKDANNEHRVSDVINQMLNGWLDIAKDTWIFNIQGNKEVAPILLFLLQSGVPYKQAVYFASMPLVRAYVKEQRDAKGTFSEPLGKAPVSEDKETGEQTVQPFWFRGKAKDEILGNPLHGFGIALDSLGAKRDGTIRREAMEKIDKEVLNEDGYFDEEQMKSNIKRYAKALKEGKEYVYNDLDRAAFLHFLEAEAMAIPVRDVKLKMNFDTSKSGTLFEAQNRIISKELLKVDSRFPSEMIDRILDDSPIGSYYVQPFQQEVFKGLFRLRTHPTVVDFLMDRMQNHKDTDTHIKMTFNDREKFANEFINDFISSIFQSSLREFDENAPTYFGYEVKQEIYDAMIAMEKAEGEEKANLEKRISKLLGIPVAQVTRLQQGIFRGVVALETGNQLAEQLYVDKRQLNREWNNATYRKQVYKRNGLAQVNPNAFDTKDEYFNFVFEREVLRKTHAFDKVKEGTMYKSSLANVLATNKKESGELQDDFLQRMRKLAYEEYLRDKALINTYNHWALFKSDSSFADRFITLRTEYKKKGPNDFTDQYLVQQLSFDARSEYTNLKLNDSFIDGDTGNVFHENLLFLMDPNQVKVDNPVDNEEISDLFRKFAIVAFLQSGMNTKSAFSLTRIVPTELYMAMIEQPVADMVEHLDRADDSKKVPLVLRAVYDRFVTQNSFKNRAARIRGKKLNGEVGIKESIQQLETGEAYKRPILLLGNPLITPKGVGRFGGYTGSKVTKASVTTDLANKDKVYAYNLAIDNPSGERPGPSHFYHAHKPNAIGIPTLSNFGDGGKQLVDVDGKIDPRVKEGIDDAIQALKDMEADGKKIFFDKEGYGQYMVGFYKPMNKSDVAKQTFLYLSKRLLDEFGFINPGYLGEAAGRKEVQSGQFINDQMVLDFMKHCIK